MLFTTVFNNRVGQDPHVFKPVLRYRVEEKDRRRRNTATVELHFKMELVRSLSITRKSNVMASNNDARARNPQRQRNQKQPMTCLTPRKRHCLFAANSCKIHDQYVYSKMSADQDLQNSSSAVCSGPSSSGVKAVSTSSIRPSMNAHNSSPPGPAPKVISTLR